MLEAVGLGVDGIDLEPECLGEVLLQQPVVPDHLDRDLLAGRREDGAAVALVADEAEGRESLQYGRRRRRRDAHPVGDRRRGRAPVLLLELVDLLEVVLERFAELA